MNNLRYIVLFWALAVFGNVFGDNLPDKPVPPRLVNDLANILTPEQNAALEQKLTAYNDSTSTQIAVVTINDLKGYAISDFAQRLGQKWGVGQAKHNNGVMILIKPKLSAGDRGEVWISTGYGMEEKLTDLMTHRIINEIMIPEFQRGDIYSGVDKAVDTIIAIFSGTYRAEKKEDNNNIGLFLIPIIILLFFIFAARQNKYRYFDNTSSNSGSKPVFFPGSFGGGGGSSRSGGGGGGFGGFGGGSFGGGGAGGSW